MNKVNVNKVVDYANLLKENERLHSIIKEVREYIENEDNQTKRGIYPNYWYEVKEKDILEILDKVGDEK